MPALKGSVHVTETVFDICEDFDPNTDVRCRYGDARQPDARIVTISPDIDNVGSIKLLIRRPDWSEVTSVTLCPCESLQVANLILKRYIETLESNLPKKEG